MFLILELLLKDLMNLYLGGSITSGGGATFGGDVYTTGTSNSFSVISRDNMYVDAGQFYIGADDAVTDDTFRQRIASGSYFIESRKSGTWTNRLQINSGGTLIVSQGATIGTLLSLPEISVQNQINTTSANLEFNFKNGDGTITSYKPFLCKRWKKWCRSTITRKF